MQGFTEPGLRDTAILPPLAQAFVNMSVDEIAGNARHRSFSSVGPDALRQTAILNADNSKIYGCGL